jgi:hypothetical protein
MKILKISLLTNTEYTILSTIIVNRRQRRNFHSRVYASNKRFLSNSSASVGVTSRSSSLLSREFFSNLRWNTNISSEQVECRTWLEFENNVWATAAHLNSLNNYIFHFKLAGAISEKATLKPIPGQSVDRPSYLFPKTHNC